MGLEQSPAAVTETQVSGFPEMPNAMGRTTLTGLDGFKDTVRQYLSRAGLAGEIFGEADDVQGVAQAWFLQLTGDQGIANLLAEALVKSQGEGFVFADTPAGKIFTLEKLAEQGTQGVLYRVLDTRNRVNEQLAAKVLPLRGDEHEQSEAGLRFIREAKILEAICPARVAPAARGMGKRVHDGQEEHFQLMEYIDGFQMKELAQALAAVRQKNRGRSKIGAERAVARLLGQMLHAEALLGDYGVVHRDIKPANMMLRKKDGTLALIDFGLAIAEEGRPGQTRVTRTGVIAGTPAYMAPLAMEQGVRRGGSVTAADLFSIGATAHEYLSGKPPIQEATIKSLMLHVAEWDGELPHLEDIEDRALRDVLSALLDRDETKRGDPLKHVLALREAGLVPWKRRQILGADPLAMPMPKQTAAPLDAVQLAEFWAQECTPPMMSRRMFIGSAVAATLVAIEAKTGYVRSKINPAVDDRPFREAIVREPEKPQSPYGVVYQSSRTSDGQEMRTGIQEITLQLSEHEIARISGDIPGVRDAKGGLQAYMHGMTVDQIESMRATFRSQNTGSPAVSRCVSAYVAPDGALVMMIPHVGLVCQDNQGRIEYVWDLQWTQAMKNTTPPPKEIELFFSSHFPADFETGLSAGESLDPLRDQVPDIKALPTTWNAKDVASKNWSKIKRACKLDATRIVQSEQ